ncbi:hypothetical protein ACLOJK_033861 [Asimina triloba]
MKMMSKIGIAPGAFSQSIIPGSMQSMSMIPQTPSANIQTTAGNAMQMASRTSDNMENGLRREVLGNHSEKVISNFLQNPVLKDEEMEINELAGQLRSENNIFQVLLKHQKMIEELVEENEKFRRMLMEDLNTVSNAVEEEENQVGNISSFKSHSNIEQTERVLHFKHKREEEEKCRSGARAGKICSI